MKQIFPKLKISLLIILAFILGAIIFSFSSNTAISVIGEPCVCGPWNDISCGGNGCADDQMYQIRDCDPPGCKIEDRCIGDTDCEEALAGEGESCSSTTDCQAGLTCWKNCDGKCHANAPCVDNDNDGYGSSVYGTVCGCTYDGIDCNDSYKGINPGASEICWGSQDEDCDGKIDCLDSDCAGGPNCISCSTADDCSQNPACYRTRCLSNVCVYDQYNCTANGVCCYPACSYVPGAPNYDPDCENYCPDFGIGLVTVDFPPVPEGVGSLGAYGNNSGIKGVAASRHVGNFGAEIDNKYNGVLTCSYPYFARGWTIMDTTCIPENATISNAWFNFNNASVKGWYTSSLWIDNSSYDDDNNRWIINTSNYPNNGVQFHYLQDACYSGAKSIALQSQYLQYIEKGDTTKIFMRYGKSGQSDASIAATIYDCPNKGKPYPCGDNTNCACRWTKQGPRCGKSDPCYYASNLKTGIDGDCVGCPKGGYVPKNDTHMCFHLQWQGGEVTAASPVLKVEFYNPGSPPTIELYQPLYNICVNYIPTFKAKIWDEDFPAEKAKAYFEISSTPPSSGWGSEVNIDGAISQYKPASIPDGQWWWRAYAKDNIGNQSAWTDSWIIGIDRVKPTAILDQENGISPDTSIWVNLTETDDNCGVVEGDVDVRINSGSWVNTGLPNGGSTINNFVYTGVDGSTYEFRYRVKDEAGNWSAYSYDGSVTIDVNDPPTATCNDTETWYCTNSRNPKLEWTYSDPNGDPQESYWLQIDNNKGFGSPEINTEEVYSSGTSYQPPDEILNWNIKYYWRIKVKDDQNNWSVWCSPICSFTTPKHAYPNVNFSWSPSNPSALESVQFTDNSECYDDVITGSDCSGDSGKSDSFSWTFPNANPLTSSLENPVATPSAPGPWDVKLKVTDSDGFWCEDTQTVNVSQPLPEWREVRPK